MYDYVAEKACIRPKRHKVEKYRRKNPIEIKKSDTTTEGQIRVKSSMEGVRTGNQLKTATCVL